MGDDWNKHREKIIGLGEHSLHKSYYPELQNKIDNLKVSQKNLETVINSISDSIVIIDLEGNILSINEQAKKTFNIQILDNTHLSIFDILVPFKENSSIQSLWDDVIKSSPRTFECKGKQLNTKNEIELHISISPTIWNGKQALVSVIRDFTERKKFEKELIDAKTKAENADKLKTEFINNLSHEIRTPMNGIVGYASLLNEEKLSSIKQNEYSKIIKNSSFQLLKIIEDILEISTLVTKQTILSEEEFFLNDFLMEVFSKFNSKSKVQNIPIYVKKQFQTSNSKVIGDKSLIKKILNNLIENALKYTVSGFIEIGYYVENDKLVLYVKDTGIGISSKNKETIFERFSKVSQDMTGNHRGLGLGLSISNEIAKILGGSITLESKIDKGSTFYFTLPYKPIKVSQTEIKNNKTSFNPKSKRFNILIAEDEEINFFYLETIFRRFSEFDIVHAKNGQEAVDICFSNMHIDLILMDIKMPIMNGHIATKKIKQKLPKLPIIAQTAYSTDADKKIAFKHGCDDFISKPIKKSELYNLINKHLNNNTI